MNTYTVFGLVDNSANELTIAAVVYGEVGAVDENSGDEYSQRWAGVFEATDPDHAEALAHAEIEARGDSDVDDE